MQLRRRVQINPLSLALNISSVVLAAVGLILVLFKQKELDNPNALKISKPMLDIINKAIFLDQSYLSSLSNNEKYEQYNQVRQMLIDVAADPLASNKLSKVLQTKDVRVVLTERDKIKALTGGNPLGGFYVNTKTIYLTRHALRHSKLKFTFLHELHHAFNYLFGKNRDNNPFSNEQEYQRFRKAVLDCQNTWTNVLHRLWTKKQKLYPHSK